MGLVPIGNVKDYWATNSTVYNFEYPKSIMPRNRYQLLLSVIHFNDNRTIQRDNRLGKIEKLLALLQTKFQTIYTPDENIVIDESLVPWRGRLIFRQYIPNKAHKYGIKLFKLCADNGYTWSVKIYAGKASDGVRDTGLAQNVCFVLADGLLDQGRTLYDDNFYSSFEMATAMLGRKTHVVGTVRANKKNLP